MENAVITYLLANSAFLLGLVFYAGKILNRVETLEKAALRDEKKRDEILIAFNSLAVLTERVETLGRELRTYWEPHRGRIKD